MAFHLAWKCWSGVKNFNCSLSLFSSSLENAVLLQRAVTLILILNSVDIDKTYQAFFTATFFKSFYAIICFSVNRRLCWSPNAFLTCACLQMSEVFTSSSLLQTVARGKISSYYLSRNFFQSWCWLVPWHTWFILAFCKSATSGN